MLAQVATAHPRILEQGGDVIGVAPAAGYQATHLMETSIPYELLMDRDHKLAERIDLGSQSLLAFVFNLKAWWNYLSAFARHWRQGKITASYTVLPAVLVVDADAFVTYLYRGTGIADYPPLTDVMAELETALRSSP